MSESTSDGSKPVESPPTPTNPPAPDPSSGPQPVAAAPAIRALGTIGLTVVSGGVAFLFAGAMLSPCVGATRSARLSQGQRRQEIAEAILQINAEELHRSGSPLNLPPDADVVQ